MAKISSNSLFHFTSSVDNLFNILQFEFSPHYSLEDWRDDDRDNLFQDFVSELHFSIPIVSFCDKPLSQTTEHMSTYGRYAIGLKKDWGLQQGISPVFYMHDMSPVINTMTKILDEDIGKNIKSDFITHIGRIFTLCKPYEGYRDDFTRGIGDSSHISHLFNVRIGFKPFVILYFFLKNLPNRVFSFLAGCCIFVAPALFLAA